MNCSADVPFNCPKCGGALVYLYTVDHTLFYRCARDGVVVCPPDGRITMENAET